MLKRFTFAAAVFATLAGVRLGPGRGPCVGGLHVLL